MKFDYIIIGGGLCGLSAGIRLAEQGKKTAVVSSGQSALHFFAGSFGLIGKNGGKTVLNPLEEIDCLPERHPYRLMGKERVKRLATEVPAMLQKAGITVTGSAEANHFTLTPFGKPRPSWLTLNGLPTFSKPDEKPFEKALIVSIKGFLESYPAFMVENLEKKGVCCRVETIDLERLTHLRESNFDMRAASIAKQMDRATIEEFASKINSCAGKDESVLIPAVIGINDERELDRMREMVNNPLYCVPTIPVSVPGLRAQHILQHYFEKLGGTYLLGDRVEKGIIEDGIVKALVTTNFGEDHLHADAFILASGNIFGEGIKSNPHDFYEPVFGLDVNYSSNRDEWYAFNFFDAQPYMEYGVEIDNDFHPSLKGIKIKNLFVAGSTLAHCNSLKEDSGAGTAILTGLHTADLAMNI